MNRVNLYFSAALAEKGLMKMINLCLFLLGILLAPLCGVAEEQKSEFKNQKKSNWESVDPQTALSFQAWKEDADLKGLFPDWQKILAERSLKEKVGNVFQCVGVCRVDRGEGFFNASHRSSLYEGDEFQTIGESYAWIFLLDGTMLRLSPHSSVTFNEFNIGQEQFFINVRLNSGNILWLSRHESAFHESNVRETDVLFFPLKLYEAMPVTDKRRYDEEELIALVEDTDTRINQYKALNGAIEKNNQLTKKKPTFAFLVLPNATVMGTGLNLEVIVLIGDKSFLKSRSSEALGLIEEMQSDAQIQLRGFDNKELRVLNTDTWMVVDEKGRSLGLQEDTYWLSMGEFITRRIPSIMLGRELFLQEYSAFAFDEKMTALSLALNHGYRLWSALDVEARLNYLKEYFRRVETSNLLNSSNFRQRLEKRGDVEGARGQIMEYGNHFFIKALNRYYTFEDDPIIQEYDHGSQDLNSTKKLLWKKMNGIR